MYFNIDHKMVDGWTALMYAAMNGYMHIVMLLVKDGGADINCTDKFHRSALHWACRFNNVKMIQKLLSLNINYNNTDIEGQSAKDLAHNFKNFEAENMMSEYVKKKKHEAQRKRKVKETQGMGKPAQQKSEREGSKDK